MGSTASHTWRGRLSPLPQHCVFHRIIRDVRCDQLGASRSDHAAEEDAFFDGERIYFLDGRQESPILIPRQ